MAEHFATATAPGATTAYMQARGLKPMAELGRNKPCGTRLRYYSGCRCSDCRRANTEYEKTRRLARADGDHRGLVDTARALAHLQWLSERGVGYRNVAEAASVSTGTLYLIRSGKRTRIRAHVEKRLLAVTPAALADGAHVDASPSWALIEELLAWGYSRARIASEMRGRRAHALQLSRGLITLRNATLVQRVHARLKREPAAPVQALLAELSEEGFHRNRVQRLLADTAAARGEPEPDLSVLKGTVLASAAAVVRRVHAQLIAEE